MPTRRWLLLPCVLIGIVAVTGGPSAQAPTAFHGIGQLPGLRAQPASIIRDATRVGNVIYAVGGAAARLCSSTSGLCGETDTAVLWRFDGTNPATLQALPALPGGVTNTTSTTPMTAYAITPDAAFIGSQARTNATNGRVAVRVTTSSLMTLNLNTLFVPALTALTAATATSSDGTILYGSTNEGTRNPLFPHLGVRFDAVGAASLFIPFLSPTDTWNPVAERGSSADGSVVVGSSFSALGANHRAYRYEHGSGVTAIPLLNGGGTFNDALAVSRQIPPSPDGDLVLVTGNSGENPHGEAYLYRAGTGVIAPLGSPNTAWGPDSRLCAPSHCLNTTRSGGMTADGSVVVISFGGADGMSGYFRNTHGWFHLTSALGANGVDFAADGWDTEKGLRIHGISSDGTLVFGAGVRYGNIEGFVAEFGNGVLASFNPQATPPLSTALVGVWTFVDPGDPAPTDPEGVVVFTADGVYYHIQGEPGEPLAGFERGLYTFNGSQLAFTTLLDTNGSTGLSDTNGSSFSTAVSGDTLIADGQVQAYRIAGSPGSILGGWVGGNPTEAHNSFVFAFAQNKHFAVFDFSDGSQSEVGTYTWDPITHELVATVGGVSDPRNFVTLTPNGLGLHVVDDGGEVFDLTRVIDPATIPVITNPQLSASGIAGQAFTYGVTATNTVTFGATGLPDGLSIDSSTGEISGTPTVGGQFAVTILATNVVGVSDIETLTLTIAIPTPVGRNVVIEPEVPEGQGPVTLSFGEITTAGTTTVTIVDQGDTGGPAPPTGFQVDGLIYDLSTTAVFTGPVTVCLPYSNSNPTPQLYHFEDVPPPAWVNRTTSVDTVNHVVCGVVTSLSPFAVLGPVPFAALNAKAEIELDADDHEFEVKGTFTVGTASDGIDPLTEEVTLAVGTFSTTIPAGSFRRDKKGRFTFEGVVAGAELKVRIRPAGGGRFTFSADGEGVNLSGTVNPVMVGLVVGNDAGSVSVVAEIE